jgi:hypothetical protein
MRSGYIATSRPLGTPKTVSSGMKIGIVKARNAMGRFR